MTDKGESDAAWEEFSSSLEGVMTRSDDTVAMVLRAHLWIERELTELVRAALPNPPAFDFERASFPLLVGLADALRVLRSDFVPPLKQLNKLRNRIAHEVGADPDEADQERLWSSLTEYWRRSLQESAEPAEREFPGRLRFVLTALIVFLYVDREKYITYRQEQQQEWGEIERRLEEMRQRWRSEAGGAAVGP